MRSCVWLVAIVMFGAMCVAGRAQTAAGPQGYGSPDGNSEIPRTAARGPTLYALDEANDLATVDLSTGKLTIVGKVSVPGGNPVNDIAFAPDGTLWGISFNGLYFKINPETAAVTSVHHTISDLVAITFASTGRAYVAPNGPASLYSLDPATGRTTLIGSTAPYIAQGDLVFYNDHLLMSGSSANKTYLATLDPRTGRPLRSVRIGLTNLFGLASTGKHELYGFANFGLYRLFPGQTVGNRVHLLFDYSASRFAFYGATYDGNFQP